MSNFILEEFYKKYGKHTHTEIFMEYIKETFDASIIEDIHFSLLDENDFISSLKYYIADRQVTAKTTASAFWGNLKKLYETLNKDYNITNDCFVNGNFLPSLETTAKTVCSVLNDTVDKDVVIDEDFNKLVEKINDFNNSYSYDIVINGLDDYWENNNFKSEGLTIFRNLYSICAIQFVIEYGLKNNIVRDIKIDDLDIENATFNRNGYILPIPSKLLLNLKRYINVRSYIISKSNVAQDFLFINFDGLPFTSQAYSAKLFSVLKDLFNNIKAESFARKTLIEMVKKGFSAELIAQLTDYKGTSYTQVCNIVNSNQEYLQHQIENFVTDRQNKKSQITRNKKLTPKIHAAKSNHIICPFCKREVKAVSSELVLVKFTGDDTLYLACNTCGGQNVE